MNVPTKNLPAKNSPGTENWSRLDKALLFVGNRKVVSFDENKEIEIEIEPR
jgi:hypothetical protein